LNNLGAVLKQFLHNPTLQASDRKKGLSDMMSKLGQPTELTKNFFEVLGENGRLYETEKVCTQKPLHPLDHREEVGMDLKADFFSLLGH
jgi:F0F1-type ATP synthase delta subunit